MLQHDPRLACHVDKDKGAKRWIIDCVTRQRVCYLAKLLYISSSSGSFQPRTKSVALFSPHRRYPRCITSNVTSCRRGLKRKLRAGYRAPSLQRPSYLWVVLLCWASSIFHRRVWYCALSLLCAYTTLEHHPHP